MLGPPYVSVETYLGNLTLNSDDADGARVLEGVDLERFMPLTPSLEKDAGVRDYNRRRIVAKT